MSVSGYRQLEYPLIIDLKHPREHTHVVTHIRPNILLTHKQSFQVLSWNITGTHIGSGRSETASNSYAQGSLIPGANYSAQDDHSGVQVYLFLCAYSSPGNTNPLPHFTKIFTESPCMLIDTQDDRPTPPSASLLFEPVQVAGL